MNKVFQIIGTDGRVKETFTGTKEDAVKWHELMYDTQSTTLSEKVREIASLTVTNESYAEINCLLVSDNGKFIFELYQNPNGGKWYINRDEDNAGDEILIFSAPENIIEPKDLFFIDGIRAAFICCDCNGTGTLTDEDGFAEKHCENCLTNAPFSSEF